VSDFENALNEVKRLREDARDNLARLADAVRKNPSDEKLKAEYREASATVAAYREFERGGNTTASGNIIGGVRGIVGDITVTRA